MQIMRNKRLGLATLALGSALMLLTPATTFARDRDDRRVESRSSRDRGQVKRQKQHARTEHRGNGYYQGSGYNQAYRNGYEDGYSNRYSDGYSSGYQNGYYDQYGYWHPSRW